MKVFLKQPEKSSLKTVLVIASFHTKFTVTRISLSANYQVSFFKNFTQTFIIFLNNSILNGNNNIEYPVSSLYPHNAIFFLRNESIFVEETSVGFKRKTPKPNSNDI